MNSKIRSLIICAGIAFSASMLSCNNKADKITDIFTDKEVVAFEQLFTNINEYNTSFCVANNVDLTRATKEQRVYKRQIVLAADSGGLVAGLIVTGSPIVGVVSGAIGSLMVALRIDADDLVVPKSEAPALRNPQSYMSASSGDIYDEMGYLHNKIIVDMFNKYGQDFIATADERALFTIILDELEYNNYDVSEVKANLEANYVTIKNINNLQIADGDFGGFTTRIATAYPELADEVSVLDQYIDIYNVLPEDATVDYTVGLRQVVENAAISNQSKTVIRAGISTALGSGNLWFQ